MTEYSDLLSALGRVEPPSPDALAAAREVLWAAVAGEMLGTAPAGDADARDADRRGRASQRRRDDPGPLHRGDPGP
jgi:hypothetical protein